MSLNIPYTDIANSSILRKANNTLSFDLNGNLSKRDPQGNVVNIEYVTNINKVFYVSKQYTGTGSMAFTGITGSSYINPSTYSSINTSYVSQLNSATMGSITKTYPDPFSARNAAVAAISSGSIDIATIIVLCGEWTVGSDNPLKNGDLTGNYPNSNQIADICFSSSNAVNMISSLYQNNITYIFNEGTSISYVCSGYNISLGYHSGSGYFTSKILGKGSFIQIYGEVNGIGAQFILVNNPYATLTFESIYCIQQQPGTNFYFLDFLKIEMNVDYLAASDCLLFIIENSVNIGLPMELDINIKELKYGRFLIPYPDYRDWQQCFNFLPSTNRVKIFKVNIDNCLTTCSGNCFVFFEGSNISFSNLNLNFNVKNLVQYQVNNGYHTTDGLISMWWYGYAGAGINGICFNNNLTFNIGNAVTDLPLFNTTAQWTYPGSYNNSNTFNVGNHILVPNSYGSAPYNMIVGYGSNRTSPQGGQPINTIINGTFINGVSASNAYNIMGSAANYHATTYKTTSNKISGNFININNNYNAELSNLSSDLKGIAFIDATLINSGSTYSISSSSYRNVYFQNVHTNSSINPNIGQIGSSASVVSDLINYF